jgi:hypothetical protein
MSTSLYIDSRYRSSGSASDFQYQLSESLNLHAARLRVDKIRFTDSFYTIEDSNKYIYFKGVGDALTVFELQVMAYSGVRLATQLQSKTGRTASYSDATGDLTMAHDSSAPLLTDAQLRLYPASSFPASASPTDPRSCNNILGEGEIDGAQIVFRFLSMAPYQDLYLRSSALACKNIRGPAHTHDILCKIPLSEGIGRVVTGATPDNVYYELPQSVSLRTLDFRLTDHRGISVNLRGGSLSFQLVFD